MGCRLDAATVEKSSGMRRVSQCHTYAYGRVTRRDTCQTHAPARIDAPALWEDRSMGTRSLFVAVLFLTSLSAATVAHAQSGAPRFEVAANLNVLRVSDFGATNAGIGGRVTVDLTTHVALEGEVGF